MNRRKFLAAAVASTLPLPAAISGPCEHTWDGPGYESPDDRVWSATCSRCGCTAMSHDMRFLP